jgi:hypothetical protein
MVNAEKTHSRMGIRQALLVLSTIFGIAVAIAAAYYGDWYECAFLSMIAVSIIISPKRPGWGWDPYEPTVDIRL